MEVVHNISQVENCFEICIAFQMVYDGRKIPEKLSADVTFLRPILSEDCLYVHSVKICGIQDGKTTDFRGEYLGEARKHLRHGLKTIV